MLFMMRPSQSCRIEVLPVLQAPKQKDLTPNMALGSGFQIMEFRALDSE